MVRLALRISPEARADSLCTSCGMVDANLCYCCCKCNGNNSCHFLLFSTLQSCVWQWTSAHHLLRKEIASTLASRTSYVELILHDQHPDERSVPGCLVLLFAVVASEKGVVVGRLTFREDGDLIDCQRMGVGGKAIPPNVDKVNTSLSSFAHNQTAGCHILQAPHSLLACRCSQQTLIACAPLTPC